MKKWLFTILIFQLLAISLNFIFPSFSGGGLAIAKEDSSFISQKEKVSLEINFFYKVGCPHCEEEGKFLDEIEKKYSEVKINRYSVSESENYELLVRLAKERDAEKYIGLVPLTFAGDQFFLGFDNKDGIGRKIENSIREYFGYPPLYSGDNTVIIPIFGEIDLSKYSLPLLAVILGFFDGFNVCSLGALVLILGLALALKSRARTLIFGGIFILATAVIYGVLIFIWYKFFSLFSPYMKAMQILIGIIAIVGSGYFLKQYSKYKKPVCEMGDKGISLKATQKIKNIFGKPGNIVLLTGAVLTFAVVITVVEFPCSAVLPVIFAGILVQAHLSTFLYLLYLGIYLLFYMLDEIIVFLIAVFTMKIWVGSGKFMTWLNLAAAVILFLLGIYYLLSLI